MTLYVPESDFELAGTAATALLVGGYRAGAMEALQQELVRAARSGQRVIVLDGLDDWTPTKTTLQTKIIGCKRPQDLNSLQVAGTIQSLSYLGGVSDKYKRELSQILDPEQKRVVPDVLLFSRPMGLFTGWPTHLDVLLANLAEHSRVLIYVDGFRDLYLPMLSMVDELLLFPHDQVLPEIIVALETGGITLAQFDALPSGQFVRIPDPINQVPAHVVESV